MKAKIISLGSKKDEQIIEKWQLPIQRMNLVFELIEILRAFPSTNELVKDYGSTIPWIDRKLKMQSVK